MLEIINQVRHSETTLSFYFSERVDEDMVVEIARFADHVRENLVECMEVIACGTSMFIEFHLLKIEIDMLCEQIYHLLDGFKISDIRDESIIKKIELPVYYGEEVAVDLKLLAEAKGLSVSEVIRLHSESVYKVVSLGFAPGFAYLSGLDERLMMPRMNSPKIVKKGSLGIADSQTAVYPKESPGGWVIIGNCPVDLFDVKAEVVERISPFEVGAEVRFVPVDKEKFLKLGGQI